jgi:hypothetical protein
MLNRISCLSLVSHMAVVSPCSSHPPSYIYVTLNRLNLPFSARLLLFLVSQSLIRFRVCRKLFRLGLLSNSLLCRRHLLPRLSLLYSQLLRCLIRLHAALNALLLRNPQSTRWDLSRALAPLKKSWLHLTCFPITRTLACPGSLHRSWPHHFLWPSAMLVSCSRFGLLPAVFLCITDFAAMITLSGELFVHF